VFWDVLSSAKLTHVSKDCVPAPKYIILYLNLRPVGLIWHQYRSEDLGSFQLYCTSYY